MELISWLYVFVLVLAAIVLITILRVVLEMRQKYRDDIFKYGEFVGRAEGAKEKLVQEELDYLLKGDKTIFFCRRCRSLYENDEPKKKGAK